MKAYDLIKMINGIGINVFTGVPDSTLKDFCDGLALYEKPLEHYVAVNEGAAVGIAVGSYLGSGSPACVYMQNSGIGNAVNPVVSIANEEVYGIPMLFLVGWRGEPGTKDEPQHVYQGKITCEILEVLGAAYAIIDKATTMEEMNGILDDARKTMEQNRQFAIIVKKGTFQTEGKYLWENGNILVRQEVLGQLLKGLPPDAVIVSTTGKISRELYEQSNQQLGKHDFLFMSVGGMGHASMIAYGIATKRKDRKVICVDGDGAALMHMGALPFIAARKPENFYHIVVNNCAHESVGAVPTGCQQVDFVKIAEACGYVFAKKIFNLEEVEQIGYEITQSAGPILYEIPVNLESRRDLSRPSESARENKDLFMNFLK